MPKIFILKYCFAAVFLLFSQGFAQTGTGGRPAPGSPEFDRSFVKCWELKDDRITSFASDNDSVILSNKNGEIIHIRTSDGTQVWSILLGNKLETVVQKPGSKILTLSRSPGSEKENRQVTIRLLDSATGIAEWIRTLPEPAEYKYFLDGENLVLLNKKLQLHTIRIADGKLVWQKDLRDDLESFAQASPGEIYLLTKGKLLYRVSLSNGETISERKLREGSGSIFYIGQSLLVGDAKGMLYEISASSGDVQELFRTGGEIAFVTPVGEKILVASNDNFIYMYSPGDKKVIWKKRLPGRISVKPEVFDKYLFVNTFAGSEILVVDQSDGSVINQISLSGEHIVRDIQFSRTGLLVLTNLGIYRYGLEKCI